MTKMNYLYLQKPEDALTTYRELLGYTKVSFSAPTDTQAKLVTLRTILAFIRTALHDSVGRGIEEMFTSQFRREVKGKGKGKARVVGEDGLEEQYEGSLVGCGEWGLEEALTNWELGRLEATSSLSGKEVEIETLTVSHH